MKTYNNLALFLKQTLSNGTLELKIDCQTRLVKYKAKLREAFGFIKVEYDFTKQIFEFIDINKVVENLENVQLAESDEEGFDTN